MEWSKIKEKVSDSRRTNILGQLPTCVSIVYGVGHSDEDCLAEQIYWENTLKTLENDFS